MKGEVGGATITPDNVTKSLKKGFENQQGPLFQRFPIDAGSFKAAGKSFGTQVECTKMLPDHATHILVAHVSKMDGYACCGNRKYSFQLFVVVLYTWSVWYQLVSPSLAQSTPT